MPERNKKKKSSVAKERTEMAFDEDMEECEAVEMERKLPEDTAIMEEVKNEETVSSKKPPSQ